MRIYRIDCDGSRTRFTRVFSDNATRKDAIYYLVRGSASVMPPNPYVEFSKVTEKKTSIRSSDQIVDEKTEKQKKKGYTSLKKIGLNVEERASHSTRGTTTPCQRACRAFCFTTHKRTGTNTCTCRHDFYCKTYFNVLVSVVAFLFYDRHTFTFLRVFLREFIDKSYGKFKASQFKRRASQYYIIIRRLSETRRKKK